MSSNCEPTNGMNPLVVRRVEKTTVKNAPIKYITTEENVTVNEVVKDTTATTMMGHISNAFGMLGFV
jgi:hypothetical protein